MARQPLPVFRQRGLPLLELCAGRAGLAAERQTQRGEEEQADHRNGRYEL
jgi:hypothetical protein